MHFSQSALKPICSFATRPLLWFLLCCIPKPLLCDSSIVLIRILSGLTRSFGALLGPSRPKPLVLGLILELCVDQWLFGEESIFGKSFRLSCECTDKFVKELLIIWESSTPAIVESSSKGSSSSGPGLGGRCICGVHDSASTMGLSVEPCIM